MEIKTEIKLVSSILKMYGYAHAHEYLLIETLKKRFDNDYLCWDDVSTNSFCKTEKKWKTILNDLSNMGLAVITKNNFVTSRKKISNDWINYCLKQNMDLHLNLSPLNGHIYLLNVDIFLQLKNETEFRDFLYLSILGLFHNSKSLSRYFIKEITGLSKYLQLKIEKNNKDYIRVTEIFEPIDNEEVDYNTMKMKSGASSSPCFNAYISNNLSDCTLTNRKNSNCKVIQKGNNYIINSRFSPLIKEKNIVKVNNKKIKVKSNCQDSQEDRTLSDTKVNSKPSFDTISLLIDLDAENRNECLHYVSPLNMGMKGKRKFKKFFNDFQNMKVLTSSGALQSYSRNLKISSSKLTS